MNVNSVQMSDLLNKAQIEKLQRAQKDGKLQKACEDFEGMLLNYMFKAMEKTVGNSGLFGDSFQRDMYSGLYLEKISQQISEKRGFGLGDALFRQLSGEMDKENGDKADSALPEQDNKL